MARRVVWLVTGVVTGAASTVYAERKLRKTIAAAQARMQPDALVAEVGRTARQAARTTGSRMRDAVTTGRIEMQRREEEIWAGLADPAADDRPDTPDAGDAEQDQIHEPRGRRRRRPRESASHLGR